MPIAFEGSTATVTVFTPVRARRWASAVALASALGCGAALWFGRGSEWMISAAFILGLLAVLGFVAATVSDKRIVFDAGTEMITMARRYPWQRSDTVESRPFAGVDSIGIYKEQTGEAETDIVYTVYLRFKTGRSVYLWTIRPRGRQERGLMIVLKTDPDLESLQRLTGFRREDKLKQAEVLG